MTWSSKAYFPLCWLCGSSKKNQNKVPLETASAEVLCSNIERDYFCNSLLAKHTIDYIHNIHIFFKSINFTVITIFPKYLNFTTEKTPKSVINWKRPLLTEMNRIFYSKFNASKQIIGWNLSNIQNVRTKQLSITNKVCFLLYICCYHLNMATKGQQQG